MEKNNTKYITIIFYILVLFLFWDQPVYAKEPYTNSQYVCMVDADTAQVIYAKNAGEIRPVASTTKMLTAILVVEYTDLQETVLISKKADRTPEYTIGLVEGQEAKVVELLKAALIKSSNDAAVALAEHVAGNERFFAYLMSKKAVLLGASNTHFMNASGLPDDQHKSSAYDLALLGRYLLSIDYLGELVGLRSVEFMHPGYSQPMAINNTNQLLGSYPGADGIKTGTTNAAGKCLVASATRDKRQLIAVSLASGDRNGDCVRLLNYGFNDTFREKVIDSSVPFKDLKVKYSNGKTINIYPERDVFLWVGEYGPNIEKRVNMYTYFPKAPVLNGQVIGVIEVYAEGVLAERVRLISRESISKNRFSMITRFKEFFQ